MDHSVNKTIICIDMTSFYASCIALLEDLDIYKVPIAIIANFDSPGSVVLAASPAMKKRFHIKTGHRRSEIPHHPDIKLFEPKMSFFLNMSVAITQLIASFVPREAIHVYSVDECFVDLTGTERLWGPPEQTALAIREAIYRQFHLHSAVGMGPNMLMAKLALDLEAKKSGFARWSFEDLPTKLWPIRKLSDMWGIGKQTAKALNNLGIYSIGGLANSNLQTLEKHFGLLGNQLFHHAWGIDHAKPGEAILAKQLSYSKGQILTRDYYTPQDIFVVILEMCEDVARRARSNKMAGRTISLSVGYSEKMQSRGFQRSFTLDVATNETMDIYNVCKQLFYQFFSGEPARKLSIRLSNLEKSSAFQLELFDKQKDKRLKLAHTMDYIRSKYGSTSVLRAISYTPAGTAIARQKLVGGHLA